MDHLPLLFLLLMSVTVANAVMATKFARKGNWFSKAFEAVAPDRLQINGAREAEHEASSTEEMGLGFERKIHWCNCRH